MEEAVDCDGSECRRAVHDSEAELEPLPPHYHLIAFGRSQMPDRVAMRSVESCRLMYTNPRTDTSTFAQQLPISERFPLFII